MKTTTRLVHTRAMLRISDPWDLGQSLGWKELTAEIVDVKCESGLPVSVLIKLATPFSYKNTDCEYFVISPRLKGSSFTHLKPSEALFVGMTRIPSSQVIANDPFDLSHWRGGVALIGELELVAD